jgi:uncharacterized repeat protein (TIGR01451 family)
MRSYRIIAALLAGALVWALGVSVALAADPPSFSPATIASTDFEAASYPAWFSTIPQGGDGFGWYWGRAAGSGVSGSYGLWCAGAARAGFTAAPWPYYPATTDGSAMVDLSAASLGGLSLANQYSSALSFALRMPDLRPHAGQEDVFWVAWEPLNESDFEQHSSATDIAKTSTWVTKAWDLSSGSSPATLSRKDGIVQFKFYAASGPPSAANYQGPTIDDLKVTGFKYGPVRNLAIDSGGQHLTWQRPIASRQAGASDETRTISYRIWRRGLLDTSYTELTSDGARLADGAVSYDDSAGSPGQYGYVVQAWDAGSGSGYGELARVGTLSGVSLGVTRSATKVKTGQAVTLTYDVANIGTTTLSSVVVTDTMGAVGTIPSLAAGASSSTLKRIVSPVVDTTYASRAAGSGVSATASTSVRVPVQRLAGADRVGTAIAVSKRAFPGTAPAVVIATASRWQEPLVAASLAGQVGGPLLLVKPSNLTVVPADVANEIGRLQPDAIYVVGDATSSNALTAATYNALKAAYGTKVQPRIAGTDSYGTSRDVALKVVSLRGGTPGGTVFLARGDGAYYADALAASSLSARLRAPIVLTAPTSFVGAASTAIIAVKPTEIVVCGGTGAVSDAVANATVSAAGLPPGTFDRRGGGTRYETASLIADYGVAKLGQPSIVYVASGLNYPDALGGGVLAGIGTTAWQPVLLTTPTVLSPVVSSFVTGHPTVDHATILGGIGSAKAPVVTAAVETSLYNTVP